MTRHPDIFIHLLLHHLHIFLQGCIPSFDFILLSYDHLVEENYLLFIDKYLFFLQNEYLIHLEIHYLEFVIVAFDILSLLRDCLD